METVELSHAGEVLVDGESLALAVLALVSELEELVVDGVVGVEFKFAAARRLVRQATLLDLAVWALATHLSRLARAAAARVSSPRGTYRGERKYGGRGRGEERVWSQKERLWLGRVQILIPSSMLHIERAAQAQ